MRFNDAQRAYGVTVLPSPYVPENVEVWAADRREWKKKQTDNVALELIMDARRRDVALLLGRLRFWTWMIVRSSARLNIKGGHARPECPKGEQLT